MIKVYCIQCGVMRMAEQDLIASEKEAKKTTKEACPICGCPFVEEIDGM